MIEIWLKHDDKYSKGNNSNLTLATLQQQNLKLEAWSLTLKFLDRDTQNILLRFIHNLSQYCGRGHVRSF